MSSYPPGEQRPLFKLTFPSTAINVVLVYQGKCQVACFSDLVLESGQKNAMTCGHFLTVLYI
jgi:hypothetical protein